MTRVLSSYCAVIKLAVSSACLSCIIISIASSTLSSFAPRTMIPSNIFISFSRCVIPSNFFLSTSCSANSLANSSSCFLFNAFFFAFLFACILASILAFLFSFCSSIWDECANIAAFASVSIFFTCSSFNWPCASMASFFCLISSFCCSWLIFSALSLSIATFLPFLFFCSNFTNIRSRCRWCRSSINDLCFSLSVSYSFSLLSKSSNAAACFFTKISCGAKCDSALAISWSCCCLKSSCACECLISKSSPAVRCVSACSNEYFLPICATSFSISVSLAFSSLARVKHTSTSALFLCSKSSKEERMTRVLSSYCAVIKLAVSSACLSCIIISIASSTLSSFAPRTMIPSNIFISFSRCVIPSNFFLSTSCSANSLANSSSCFLFNAFFFAFLFACILASILAFLFSFCSSIWDECANIAAFASVSIFFTCSSFNWPCASMASFFCLISSFCCSWLIFSALSLSIATFLPFLFFCSNFTNIRSRCRWCRSSINDLCFSLSVSYSFSLLSKSSNAAAAWSSADLTASALAPSSLKRRDFACASSADASVSSKLWRAEVLGESDDWPSLVIVVFLVVFMSSSACASIPETSLSEVANLDAISSMRATSASFLLGSNFDWLSANNFFFSLNVSLCFNNMDTFDSIIS